MSIRSFIRERRSVEVAGRRFTLTSPTLATVELFVSLFGMEIEICLATHRKAVEKGIAPQIEGFVDVFVLDRARATRVLATVVETDVPERDWKLKEIVIALLGLCDMRAIVESLGLTKPEEERALAMPIEGAQEEGVVRLARDFGVSPTEIMGWPYEAFLLACQTIADMDPESEASQRKKQLAGFDPRFVSACIAKQSGGLN
jgi:hypothetical protein